MFFIASYSTREGALRRFFIIAAPVVLVGGFGGLVVMFRAAFRPSKGAPKTLVGGVQTVIETAAAVIFAIITAGVDLYLFGLDRDDEVASLVIRSADFLVTPFRRIFLLNNNYAQIALNWGIGALPYVAAALVVSGRSASSGQQGSLTRGNSMWGWLVGTERAAGTCVGRLSTNARSRRIAPRPPVGRRSAPPSGRR